MNRKMRKTLPICIVLLLTIVLISGCIGGGNGAKKKKLSPGPGLVVTDFFSDFESIDQGEEMFVAVDFENRGDSGAKNIKGTLIRQGAFEIITANSYFEAAAPLEPPLEEVYSSDEFYWQIKAPGVSQDRVEEIQARVNYDYWTEGYATIHFVPRDIEREKGRSAFQLDPSTTNGPVAIEISANQPITIKDEAEEPREADGSVLKTVRVNIILSNSGTGRVESSDISTYAEADCNKELDCIDTLEIDGYGPTCTIEDPENPGIYISLSDLDEIEGIKLIQGEEGKKVLSLTFKVNDPNAETSCQIKARATYRYRVDSEVLPINILAD